MSDYQPPVQDQLFALEALTNVETLSQQLGAEGVNDELVAAILDEAARLGSEVLAPLNSVGDLNGAKLVDGAVQETEGFAQAYAQFVENGWQGLTAEESLGGQNLPKVVGTAVNEIWHSANMAFALCPMLTQGAIEALSHHGSDALKTDYLPKLVSGEWTGTMNLTEPDAGSDLAALKAKATPEDGHYLIRGQKIFITWGDHQMADNIIHLVLARLPDAPAGVKGISLFAVPKFLPDASGNFTQLNDVSCVSLEHKMGIHASPTCVMSFGDQQGAVGYLIGEAHNGLACMFTMMNDARQAVGLQGVSIAERSYQQTAQYARERIQGTRRDGSRFAIIEFPDVRRMLMLMRAETQAMRGVALQGALAIDQTRAAADAESAARQQRRNDLLTPIIKGWITEMAQEVTSLGIQVYGGMGYVEETGVAQFYRDARILPIYEGTTGIQAMDLIGRKTLFDQGAAINELLEDITALLPDLELITELKTARAALAQAIEQTRTVVAQIIDRSSTDKAYSGSVANAYLMLMGYLCGAAALSQQAILAHQKLLDQNGDPAFMTAKITTTAFYFDHILPRIQALIPIFSAGSDSVMALSAEQF